MYQEFPDESCPRNAKPTTVQSCGNDACAPQWFTSKWGKVQLNCSIYCFSRVYVLYFRIVCQERVFLGGEGMHLTHNEKT